MENGMLVSTRLFRRIVYRSGCCAAALTAFAFSTRPAAAIPGKPAGTGAHKTAVAAKAPPVAPPSRLAIEPAKFELRGHRAQLQLVVTGTYAGERIRDLTSDVKYTSSDP